MSTKSPTTDELLGIKGVKQQREMQHTALWRRLKKIEGLPKRDRKALLHYLDAHLKKLRRKRGGVRIMSGCAALNPTYLTIGCPQSSPWQQKATNLLRLMARIFTKKISIDLTYAVCFAISITEGSVVSTFTSATGQQISSGIKIKELSEEYVWIVVTAGTGTSRPNSNKV